jgi:hypothetical protein
MRYKSVKKVVGPSSNLNQTQIIGQYASGAPNKHQKNSGIEYSVPMQQNAMNASTRPGSKKRKSTTAAINVKKSMLNMTTTLPKGTLNALTPNQQLPQFSMPTQNSYQHLIQRNPPQAEIIMPSYSNDGIIAQPPY